MIRYAFAFALSAAAGTMMAAANTPSVDDGVRFQQITATCTQQVKPSLSVKSTCDVAWPAGDDVLVQALTQWVCKNLGYEAYSPGDGPESVVLTLVQNGIRSLKEEAEDFEGDWTMEFEEEMTISRIFENDDFVTLDCTMSGYTGGAHGYNMQKCATFRKADGKEMGWDLVGNMTKAQIDRALKDGLQEYADVSSDIDLVDALFMEPADFENDFPLPAVAPFLTSEGVEVIYQQYEIAPYSFGMPACVIVPMKNFNPKK